MCGLLYARNTEMNRDGRPVYHSVTKRILKQYYNQKERGIDGFGIYDGEHQHLIKETTERRIVKWLRTHKSSEILFHHRIPTSTDNVKNAAHPFTTKDYFGDTEYIFIHNGIVNNAYSLMKLHEFKYKDNPIEYTSRQPDGRFNDSEALMWDIALTLEGKQDKPHAYGSVAFICIEKHKDDPNKNKLHYFRNTITSPLYKVGGKKMEVIVSKPEISQKAELIQSDVLHSFEYSTRVEKKVPFMLSLMSSGKTSNIAPMKSIPANVSETAEHNYQNHTRMGNGPFRSEKVITPTETARQFVESAVEEAGETLQVDSEYIKQSRFYEDIKDLREDFNAICMEYLNDCEGHIYAAIQNMKDAMEKLHKAPYSIQNWKEIMLLQGGIAILVTDPKSTNPSAQATEWEDSPSEEESLQTVLPLKEQSFADHITEKVRAQVEQAKKENKEAFDDIQEHFYSPINTDTVDEILDLNNDNRTVREGTVVSIQEVIPKSSFMDLLRKKHKIEETPSLITQIPREDLA